MEDICAACKLGADRDLGGAISLRGSPFVDCSAITDQRERRQMTGNVIRQAQTPMKSDVIEWQRVEWLYGRCEVGRERITDGG